MAAWLLCPYGTKALPTLMRFRFHKWFRCARPFVHTNTPSVFIESASICWKRSWKWIKTKTRIHAYRISVDAHRVQLTSQCAILSFYSKTHRNGSVDVNQLMRFLWQRFKKTYTSENELYCGQGQELTKNRQKEKNDWLCFGSYFQQMNPITVSQCFFFLLNDKPLLF